MAKIKTAKQRAAAAEKEILAVPPPKKLAGVSSGSTLINLACTGRTNICFLNGHYYFFVGDSSSGKTFLALTMFAEAANNKRYNEYDFFYFGKEHGALMDFTRYFGAKAAARIQPPMRHADGKPKYHATLDKWYFWLEDRLKQAERGDGLPLIGVLDSMDSMQAAADIKAIAKQAEADKKNKEAGGGFGMGKAKLNSQHLPDVVSLLERTGSILIIISQTRQNIDPLTNKFVPKKRSGGDAIKFYATLELWTKVREKITPKIKGKNREIGIVSQVDVKKNRVQGKNRRVFVPIYHSVGIDDIGSCIDYLVDEGHWKENSGKIIAKEFGVTETREKLVSHIEATEQERELRLLVREVWDGIEAACVITRKQRYE